MCKLHIYLFTFAILCSNIVLLTIEKAVCLVKVKKKNNSAKKRRIKNKNNTITILHKSILMPQLRNLKHLKFLKCPRKQNDMFKVQFLFIFVFNLKVNVVMNSSIAKNL